MNRTPNGKIILAYDADGVPGYRDGIDVTEAVQALYDLVVQSMDWGSGFLTAEDAEPVALIARVCGFERLDEAERYLEEARRRERGRVQASDDERERFAWAMHMGGRPMPVDREHPDRRAVRAVIAGGQAEGA
jgi:hypothetical protein